MIHLRIIFCTIIIFTLGCTHQKNTSISSAIQPNSVPTFIQCPEHRLPMCTRDYRPVCATRDTGVRCVTTPCPSTEEMTYSNGCTACADTKVLGYIPNTCEQKLENR
jgi:hypothetical protein